MKLIKAIKDKEQYTEQIAYIKNFREFFREVIQMKKDDWKAEFKYWQDRGWVQK